MIGFRFSNAGPKLWAKLRLLLMSALTVVTSEARANPASNARADLLASPEPGWPQFRGPRRDGISDERGLLQSWPEGGPKLIWSADGAGRGYSSPIVANGRLFVTGDFGEDLYLLAYDLEGKPLWRVQNGRAWLHQHQGARASVTCFAGRLYHQNAHGRVACFDAATGKELWSVETLEKFGGENIRWGISECLLVDERAVYVTPGGSGAFLVALNRSNGEVLWKTEALAEAKQGEGGAGYAAPIFVRFAGRRLIVGASAQHLFAVDADKGQLQWTRSRETGYSVLAMSPVLVEDAIFMSAPLGPPGALHKLIASRQVGGKVEVEDKWTTDLDPAQGGAVYMNGRIYGAYYPRNRGWAALEAATGQVLYEAPEFVKGAALFADRRLYALCEDGWLLLLEPTDSAFKVHGRFKLTAGRERDVWAHPSIVDGRMYLRYHDKLFCHDIRD